MENEEKALYCTQCGAALRPDAKFCVKCGASVAISADAEPKAEEPETEEAVTEENVPEVSETTEATEEAVAYESAGEDAANEETSEPVYTQVPPAETPKKEKKKVGVFACILTGLVTAAVSILTCLIIFILLLNFDILPQISNQLNSVFDNYNSRIEALENKSSGSSSTSVGDGEVKKGDNVTINISGNSEDLGAAVYAKASQSTVGIRVVQITQDTPWSKKTTTAVGEAAGVIYTSDGYIITNEHVVTSAVDDNGKLLSDYEIHIYLDTTLTKYYKAEIIGVDAETDLALLKIDVTGLVPVEFGDYDDIAIGEAVFTIGCPTGIEYMNTICDGIVSALGRDITTDSGSSFDLIQTTASINMGNSGGGLFNAKGQLIGISEAKLVSTYVEDINYAINIETIKVVITSLKEKGVMIKPVLGVVVITNFTADSATQNGYPAGAWIESISEGGAAEKAGITKDMIITAFNGERVLKYAELRRHLFASKPGDTVKITTYNKTTGEYKDFTVTLQSSAK